MPNTRHNLLKAAELVQQAADLLEKLTPEQEALALTYKALERIAFTGKSSHVSFKEPLEALRQQG